MAKTVTIIAVPKLHEMLGIAKTHVATPEEERRIRRNAQRRERDQAMRDLGLVKVRGGLGGAYWE